VKLQRLVSAAAVLGGREMPGPADLWPIVYAVPEAEAQAIAREALRDLLAETENAALSAAAVEASQGPLARAARIAADAEAVLAARPQEPEAVTAWRLRLEGVAREIDAGFAADALPAALSDARARVVQALGEGGGPPPEKAG
jgi:MoxR-like ATPase